VPVLHQVKCGSSANYNELMKAVLLLIAAISCAAQVATAPQAAPGSPPPSAADVSPDTVVATIEGRKVTAGELNRFIAALPQQLQQNFQANKKEFVRQYALMRKLSELAEQNKLAERSPYKERLEYARVQMLVQAQMDEAGKDILVTPEEQKKFYEANPDRYTTARIKVIYIPYSANVPANVQGRKVLTEAEAAEKAARVVKEARAGADFVKLVKEHSEDPTSAAKDGEFGTVRRSDTLPEPIKNTIFALKPGEVSDPVKQPNGFYVFRVEESGLEPYEKVKDNIYNDLKQQKFQTWFEGMRKAVDVKFENEAYFAPAPGASPGFVPGPVKPAPGSPKPSLVKPPPVQPVK
jgi:peptidyl-prolyl cis-trans isomerase C